MYVEIGIDSAKEGYRDPNSDDPELVRYRPAEGERIVQMVIPEDRGLRDAFVEVTTALTYHLADDGKVHWIESDSDGLARLLIEEYELTDSKTHRPKNWGRETGADKLPRPGQVMQAQNTLMSLMLVTLGFLARFSLQAALLQAFLVARMTAMELRTSAGVDFQTIQMSGAPGAAANYIGLTANATAPATGDTTLTGEITAGTLARAQATFAHTNATNTYTLTKTFTSDQSVVVAKIGVFNAAAVGTLVFETLLNQVATLVSGDQLQITDTITV